MPDRQVMLPTEVNGIGLLIRALEPVYLSAKTSLSGRGFASVAANGGGTASCRTHWQVNCGRSNCSSGHPERNGL